MQIRYFDVLRWIRDNWVTILLTIVVVTGILILVNKILPFFFYDTYKEILAYERLLMNMKMTIEDDHDDELWKNPDFCEAFLKLHEDFQQFLSVARSDRYGKLLPLSQYNRYAQIRLR